MTSSATGEHLFNVVSQNLMRLIFQWDVFREVPLFHIILFTLLVDGIAELMSDVNIVAYADDMYFIYEADSWEGASTMASQNT